VCASPQVSAEWVAQSVELLGGVVESQGWMYFVREAYSVLITEGGLGFGYVYAQNDFVESQGVAMERWYGCRALFRACMDVPDRDRFGVRWKALMVRLLPEHPKGASRHLLACESCRMEDCAGSYRYAGIYRPSAYSLGGVGGESGRASALGRPKELDQDTGEDLELPDEALTEMRLIGKDLAGVGDLCDALTRPRPAPVKEHLENLLNEVEDPATLAKLAAASLPPSGTFVLLFV